MIITLLRKPLDGSVSDNTLKHGCGAINIDKTRIGVETRTYKGSGKSDMVYSESRAGMSDGRGKDMEFSVEGRWPANFILIHKDGCELKGTKKVKGHKGYPNGPGGIWSKDYQAKHQKDRNLTDVKTVKDNEAWMGHADKDGKETVADWDCVESCPVKELDRQSGRVKGWSSQNHNTFNPYQGNSFHNSSTQRQGYKEGYNDDGGASRFFKQFKLVEEKVEYFKKLITPPVDDACVIVSSPSDIDFSSYKIFDDGALIPTSEPMVHGLILLGEPTEEQSKEIMKIIKPGGHVLMIPNDIGYNGVIALEDIGFEVRDAIFVADGSNNFHYTSKASRSEREAGLSAESGDKANTHPTVKPIDIMEWCARDIPSSSKVVDPFLGSGTTGIAMSRLGNDFVGIELNPEYAKICESRIRHWMPIGTKIESEAQVGKAQPQEGEQISIFDIFGDE